MKTQNNIKRAAWILFSAWTFVFILLFLFSGNYIRQSTKKQAISMAQAYFNKDLAFRKWVSEHGGLYVPVTKKTPPNQYLTHIATRDITSSDGTALTLMNPAYAVRQHNEMFARLYGVTGHITSLKLMRPENAPDAWERKALEKFELNITEVQEITNIDGQPHLRLIQPLIIQKGCLKCHSHQNYKIGEIRGGVAIAVPMASMYAEQQSKLFTRTLIIFILWFLGSCLIIIGSNKLSRASQERDELLLRLNTLYQKSTDGILLIQDGKFIDSNEAADNMLGYPEKTNIIGHHPADFSPEIQPDGRSSFEKAEDMMQICLDQGSHRFQWIHLTAKGKNSWVEVVLTRIELQHEPVIHVSWRDINELKDSQIELSRHQNNLEHLLAERTADLQSSNKKFQLLLDDMGDKFIVFTFNPLTDEVTYISDGLPAVMGITKEDTIGKSWTTVVDWHPEDQEIARQYNLDLIEGRRDFVQLELRFTHPESGKVRTVRSSAHSIFDDTDSSVLIGGILEDITEEKQIFSQLQEAQQMAEEASKQKSMFLANMSHEIRTPMNAMIGLSELALETSLNDQQHDYLTKIHSSSRGLLTIINDILDYSKIEAGKMTMEIRTFSLPELIDEVGAIFVDQAGQNDLELKLIIESQVPSFLKGDSSRLRQILINLVGNALKFTKQGAVTVNVTLLNQTHNQVKLKFSVIDTGIGISADKLARLFQPFTQVDASHTRKYGGTGLGLAISRQLIEIMGGKLTAQSNINEGSEFTITLDLEISDQGKMGLQNDQNIQKEISQNARQLIKGAHILLVEDNTINQQVAFEILRKADLKVEIADNGKEAVEKYRSALLNNSSFNAILMDIQMPLVDGFEATALIRELEKNQVESTSHTPIIAMTAQTMAGDQEKCIASGMDDYIAKPINRDELFTTLAKWIDSNSTKAIPRPIVPSPNTAKEELKTMPPLADNLPGINFEEGLSRLEGNTELYLRLLKQFAAEQNGVDLTIKEHLQKNEIDIAKRLVHTIKGTAANLGIAVLSQAALNLENDMGADKDITASLAAFSASFDEFLFAITEIQREESRPEKTSASRSRFDYQSIAPILEELIIMLRANDFNATKKWSVIKPLFPESETETIVKVENHINKFEFDHAIKILTEISARHKAV